MDIIDRLFPQKICITLRGKTARQAQFKAQMKAIGFDVPFFVAERMSNRTEGCFDSHVRCMEAGAPERRRAFAGV